MTQAACLPGLFIDVWPVIFALDLSRYLVAAGVLALLLVLFAGPLANRRIQVRRATGTDVQREISYSLSTVLLFSLVGFGVWFGSQQGLFRIYGGDLPGAARIAIELFAIVLLHDTYFYWMHRMLHGRRLFRPVHGLHHRSRTPTPWAAYAFAPPEALIEAGILPLAALVIPIHELTVLLFVTHMVVRNVIGHAGFELFPRWWLDVPIFRWITTTTHHDLHHAHGAHNYGLYFTWWDRWMGTEHPHYATRFRAAVGPARQSTLATKEERQ